EQVCTYMCPWPRIQAAMLDEHSLTVTYNDWRGEPRDRHAKRIRKAGKPIGDCVDCNACVAVCPMGIDIRDGQQLECITCALCIDACDGVMSKLGMEKGLIAYATLKEYGANMRLAGVTEDSEGFGPVPAEAPSAVRSPNGKLVDEIEHVSWKSFVRPRTILYSAIYAAIGLALLWALAVRDTLKVNVLHDRNPLFTILSDGSVRNGYTVKILNMTGTNRSFNLSVDGLPGAMLRLAGSDAAESRQLIVEASADELEPVRVFVRVPKSEIASSRTVFTFETAAIGDEDKTSTEAHFDAPEPEDQ
ncbi:MAG: 4Fe-4S dicluster domain-containing protein, partial [Rhizobiaceae bacterium]